MGLEVKSIRSMVASYNEKKNRKSKKMDICLYHNGHWAI